MTERTEGTRTNVERLAQWLEDEVNLVHVHATEAIKNRSNEGEKLAPIWKFISSRVKDRRKIAQVRANIALSEKLLLQVSPEDDWSQAVDELTALQRRAKQLEQEILRLREEIVLAENSHENHSVELENIKLQTTLLSAHSLHRHHQASVYSEFTKRIRDRQTSIKGSGNREVTYFESEYTTTPGTVRLESTCTKQVRNVCDGIATFLFELNESKGDESDGRRKELQEQKDRIWTDVERLLSHYPLCDVLASLLEICRNGIEDIEWQADRVNVKQDAEYLRFKYEKGHLKDLSRSKPFLQSVRELIEGLQQEHIHCYLTCEEALNSVWRGRGKLLQSQRQLDHMMNQTGKAITVPLARSLISCRVEIAGEAASLHCLGQLMGELVAERTAKQTWATELRNIHRRIENFTALSQEKQSLIQLLVKQNSAAKERKVSQKTELSHYIQRTICGHSDHISSVVATLHDCVTKGVDAFIDIPVPRLRQVLDSRIPAPDMSIKHLTVQSVRGDVLSGVMKWLGVDWYKAPEQIVTSLNNLLRGACVRDERHFQVLSQLPQKLNEAQGLVVSVQRQSEQERETIQPVLQTKWTSATQALANCIHVQELVQQWWTQPIQSVRTDMVHEGLTLQQWLDRWKVLQLQLRQLQSQH